MKEPQIPIQIRIRIHPRFQLRFLIQFLILIPILFLFLIESPQAAKKPAPTPQESPALKQIIKKHKLYERQREDFKKVELKSPSQPSTEGGRADVYEGKSGKILIIDEFYFAEMGQATWSYYFEGTKPFFILVAETKYAYPITVSAEDRKKLGGAEDKTTETRYYFRGNKLIRWLEGKKPVHTKGERLKEQARSILELAKTAYQNAREKASHP